VPCLGSILAGGFLAGTANRAANAFGIAEHTDLVTSCLCAPCVSCRMAREVRTRKAMGQLPLDYRLNYRENYGMMIMAPPAPQAMAAAGNVTYVAEVAPYSVAEVAPPNYEVPLVAPVLAQAPLPTKL